VNTEEVNKTEEAVCALIASRNFGVATWPSTLWSPDSSGTGDFFENTDRTLEVVIKKLKI
jgi:hypothetical protein